MEYNANDIKTLSAGRAFREKLGMYLSADKQEAINLGLRELIVNVQDEYEVYKPKNPKVIINLNTKDKIIEVIDNMRGIPVGIRKDGMNSLTAAFLLPHSGGKHEEGVYSSAIGINGEGIKIVCHTAEWLKVEVTRDGFLYTQSFQSNDEGAHPITNVIEKEIKDKISGTKITYKPDPRVYGDIFIDISALRKMLTEMSYFTKGLHIYLFVDGKEEEFYSEHGLIDGLQSPNALSKPFSYFYETEDCKVELALQWVTQKGIIKGYANGLYMPDGGAFITGFKTSLTKTFNSLAKSNFDGDKIRGVLNGFVSVKVKIGQFSNQAKTALANPEARTATSAAITNALKDFANKNREDFNKIIELLNKITRAEAAADRARIAVMEQSKEILTASTKKILLPDKFKDCEQHGEQSMLGICEGDSALAGLATARNIENFALFPIKGKIISALKNPLEKVLQNQEVSGILKILGCGFQESYNSRKLRFGKVAICTDSDPDGASIGCLIATVFYVLMPQFIEEGRLYWLRAPFYRLKKNNISIYAYNNKELNELQKKYVGYEQVHYKGLGELTAEDMRQTMCNEQNQRLERLTLHDAEKAYQQLEVLMGKMVQDRRDFLFENVNFGEEYDY